MRTYLRYPGRLLALATLGVCAALAQAPPKAQPGPIKIGDVVFQGSLRSRAEIWDWFEGNANNSYAFSGNILRFSFSQQRKKLDWQLEFAAPFLLGMPEDAVAPAPQLQFGLGGNYFSANRNHRNAALVFPKQGFLRFKGLFGSDAHSLRLGRWEFNDGTEVMPKNPALAGLKRERITQRIIGTFGFTHVMRSFDGLHYVYNKPNFNFTLLGAAPTRGVFQVDGWGNLRVGLGYAAATGQLPGKRNNGEWRLFGIYYHDWRSVLKTDNRPVAVRRLDLANPRIGTFGGHYLHSAETGAGALTFLAWGLVQTGRWGALDHRAAAFAAEAGWQPKVLPRWKPSLHGGFFHGSGDANPGDSRHGTFFQVLPTPRPYARFPFFNLMNNQDFLGMLTLRPHASVTIKAEFHALRLADRNDLWYLGGGAFQPWTFGYIGRPSNGARSLANLHDASVDYQVNPRVTLSGYVGYAAGRAVMASIYPKGKNGTFGYLELSYRF